MRTTIEERKTETISPLGPVILVLLAVIAVSLTNFSIAKMVNGLFDQIKLAEPTAVQKAASDLESIASMSFSPLDYLPVLESELDTLAQNPQFMLHVVEQIQADFESASVADGLKFDSVLPVTDRESGDVVSLRFVASSGVIVCQNIKQIRNEHGLILAEYSSDYPEPVTKGHAVYYWSCYPSR